MPPKSKSSKPKGPGLDLMLMLPGKPGSKPPARKKKKAPPMAKGKSIPPFMKPNA